jgi:hypothetical protein
VRTAVPTEVTAGMFVMMPTAVPIVLPMVTPIAVFPVVITAGLCLATKANQQSDRSTHW